MTLLATGTGEEIVNRIEGERISKKWKYGTTLTYVEAILSAGTTTPEAHKRLLRYRKALKGHARAESRTAAPAFTATMAQRLHPAESELELAILLSFTYGQRISDMVQLASEDVGPMALGGKRYLVVTIRRAKTIKATGPYTLHVAKDTPMYRPLRRLHHNCQRRGQFFLFSNARPMIGLAGLHQLPPKEREALRNRINKILKKIDPHLESRSIRRGGLQRIAGAGVSLEEIRTHFSKHTTTTALGTYLDHCAWSNKQASIHYQIGTMELKTTELPGPSTS